MGTGQEKYNIIDMGNIPQHVTIIMDGNGRWAKSRGKERIFGHYEGAESVRVICEYSAKKGIKYLSLFAFSEENWNRPVAEVTELMRLMLNSIIDERNTFKANDIRLLVIGDRSRLSDELVSTIDSIEDETSSNKGMTLIIMLSYSGKWDILQASRRYAEEVARCTRECLPVPELDQNLFESYLSTAGIPDPDLMIRTSGEERISNYMLWQCAYTEFYFTDILWPDFREKEMDLALECYSRRDRRFGKIK